MNIIKENNSSKIIVKKSTFIASAYYVDNQNEANNILDSIKKEYYDAKHNCYAYSIGINNPLCKQSDDGEPKGTAGIPIFNAINSKQLTNIILIVTRYFGGVLLGSSLLLRTYNESAISCLDKLEISKIINAVELEISFNYNLYNSFNNYINKNFDKIFILENNFYDDVSIKLFVNIEFIEQFKTDVMNITKGSISFNNENKINYARFNNGIKIL